MKVLVAFKTVAQIDTMTPEEAADLCQGLQPFRYAKLQWASGDEAALEAALRLQDENPALQLVAATVGACHSHFFQELYALGFQRVVHLYPQWCTNFNPEHTAQALAEFMAADGPFSLVLTGAQASPGESGLVAGLLAGALSMPFLSGVSALALQGTSHLQVALTQDDEEFALQATLPVLCAMRNAKYPYLRLASLRQRLNTAQKKAELWQGGHPPPPQPPAWALHSDRETKNPVWLPFTKDEPQALVQRWKEESP